MMKLSLIRLFSQGINQKKSNILHDELKSEQFVQCVTIPRKFLKFKR